MSGVLLSGEGCFQLSGARVEVTDGKVRVIDGPFAEAKELIGGFAILEVDSLAEAVEHARKFALLVGTERVDVRRVVEAEDLSSTRPDSTPLAMNAANLDATVATLWRVESPRVLARLARFVGDLDTAEELAQDTFVAAIEKWRQDGVPDNPAAWLHTTARYLAVDRIRRRDTHRNKVRLAAATSPQVVEDDSPSWSTVTSRTTSSA